MSRQPISQLKLCIASAVACAGVLCLTITFVHTARPRGPFFTSGADRIAMDHHAKTLARAERLSAAPTLMATATE